MIKCVMLNAHCTLIAEVVEVDAEIGDPNCKLIHPYVYNSIEAVSYTHLTLPTIYSV